MKVKFLQIKRALSATLFILIMLAGMTKIHAQTEAKTVSIDSVDSNNTYYSVNVKDGATRGGNLPKTTSTENIEEYSIMVTNYDLQTNSALGNRIATWADGTASFVATWDHSNLNTFPNRGTGYNYYDGNSFGEEPEFRLEPVRSGWPSIVACGDGEILVSHNGGTSVYYCPVKGLGNQVDWYNVKNFSIGTWPRVICSGPNDQYVHIVAAEQEWNNNNPVNTIYYARSTDGGQTWSDMVEFPNMDNSVDGDYRSQLGSDDYVLASNGNDVAVLFGSDRTDVFYMISHDNGLTWERQIVAPFPMEGSHAYVLADEPNGMEYPVSTSDNSHSIAIDDNGVVHVVFGLFRWQATDDVENNNIYWPTYGYGIVYWNSEYVNEQGGHEIPLFGHFSGDINHSDWAEQGGGIGYSLFPDRITELAEADGHQHLHLFGYIDENGDGMTSYNDINPSWHYRSRGLATMPGISVDNRGAMAIIYSVWSETRICQGTEVPYRSAYVTCRDATGTWFDDAINLSSGFVHEFDEVYPTFAAQKGYNGSFWVGYFADDVQGLYMDNYSASLTENYLYAVKITPNMEGWSNYFIVSAMANPIEGGTISGTGEYEEGAVCTLSATANPGYCFLNWTENGEVVSSDAEYSFTVTGDRNLVANFVFLANHWTAEDFQNNMYMINVVLIDDVVQMTPALELGAFCNGECRGSEFPVEDEGNWLYFMTVGGNNGDDITFRLYDHALQQERILQCSNVLSFENNGLIGFDEPYEVHFSTIHYIVSATVSPENAGTITGAGEYVLGTDVTLTATPNENYTFMYWTENDEVVSTDANYSFTITADRNLVAHFTLPLSVTVTANPTEGGSVIGMGAYDYGSTCTLTAIANEGYVFNYWRKNGTKIYYLSTYSFTVTEDIDLEAVFMPVDGVLIGESDTTNQYLPSYSFFKYTLSQQIYTQDEIGAAGEITTISYFNASNARIRNFDIYMVHTDKTAFESSTDWITVSESDLVFSGSVNMLKGTWTTFVLDTPFAYNGYSNLAIIFDDNSGSWTEAPFMACRVFNTNDNQAIRVYSDYTNYDPYNPSAYNGTLHSVKNQIILGIISGQSCHLSQGWNWWSTYIEVGGAPGLTMLENALGENGLTIMSQNAFVSYNSQTGVWRGTLRSIDNASGYNIKVSESCTVVMNGAIATPEDHPITLSHGWNWMGYPVSVAQTVASAMSDFNPQTGDIVNGQNGFAVYRSNRWLPATFMMNPGESYMYYSNATENKTLVYSQGRGEAPTAESEECFWQADRHAYRENLCLMATVEVDGVEQRDETLELGAFVSGECRGSARLYYVEPIDRYIAFLTVTGEDEEQVEFRLMDQSKATSMSNDHIIFHGNAIIGNLDTPFVIHFGAMNGLTEMQLNASIYPNPMDRNMPFTLAIPEEEAVVDILITNALGEVVRHNTGSLMTSNITGLSEAGVYLLKVACRSGNVYYGRLIVK